MVGSIKVDSYRAGGWVLAAASARSPEAILGVYSKQRAVNAAREFSFNFAVGYVWSVFGAYIVPYPDCLEITSVHFRVAYSAPRFGSQLRNE